MDVLVSDPQGDQPSGSGQDVDLAIFVALWVDSASMAYAIYAISFGLVL